MASKVFIVTGASKGLGAAIVEQLVAQSYKVVVTARSEQQLQKLKDAHPGQVEYLAGDITSSGVSECLYLRLIFCLFHLKRYVLRKEYLTNRKFRIDSREVGRPCRRLIRKTRRRRHQPWNSGAGQARVRVNGRHQARLRDKLLQLCCHGKTVETSSHLTAADMTGTRPRLVWMRSRRPRAASSGSRQEQLSSLTLPGAPMAPPRRPSTPWRLILPSKSPTSPASP